MRTRVAPKVRGVLLPTFGRRTSNLTPSAESTNTFPFASSGKRPRTSVRYVSRTFPVDVPEHPPLLKDVLLWFGNLRPLIGYSRGTLLKIGPKNPFCPDPGWPGVTPTFST